MPCVSRGIDAWKHKALKEAADANQLMMLCLDEPQRNTHDNLKRGEETSALGRTPSEVWCVQGRDREDEGRTQGRDGGDGLVMGIMMEMVPMAKVKLKACGFMSL